MINVKKKKKRLSLVFCVIPQTHPPPLAIHTSPHPVSDLTCDYKYNTINSNRDFFLFFFLLFL